MANLVGTPFGTISYTSEPTNPAFGALTEPDYRLAWRASPTPYGALARTQPITELQQLRVGIDFPQFGFLDWYNRIHVEPLLMDLGNILSVQQREISTWNAFFVAHTLNDVTAFNDAGLTLTEPAATPLIFAPLQQYIYLVSIDTEGPATVDAIYSFDFDVRDIDVHIIGIRIVAWAWEPNWIDPVLERLQWHTDVMASYDGSEQRFRLRAAPRTEWEFTFDLADDQRRLFENVMYAWGGRIWALPIWIDGDFRVAAIAGGATSIVLTTAGRDFHAGGIGLIIGPDGSFEAFEVDAVQAQQIDLSRPTVSSWPQGSKVYPARTARLMDPRATGRFHQNYARGAARFRTVEEIERTALSETLYRNLPVMEREPNWRDALDIDYLRKLQSMDPGTGKDFFDDEAELALPAHSFRWTMLDRDEADYFRSWIYARKGRWSGIWLPTWAADLVLAADTSAGQMNIDFLAAGLTHFGQGDVHRRDIRIELRAGTLLYRRVTGPVVVDASTERMTLNAPLGQLVTPADVARISWMHFVRLDNDSIELAWQTPAVAETIVITKGPRNDF